MADRISSLDSGYSGGDLSVYPLAIDNKEVLYEANNNAETKLKHSLPYSGKMLIVNDASLFPSKGLLRVGPPAGSTGQQELIYYAKKTGTTFSNLVRGFAGSQQNRWPAESVVINPVTAEHHNAIKDAIFQIENNLGLKTSPAELSLNRILKDLETKWLAPRPIFRASKRGGPPPLTVQFQNFGHDQIIRYLWDFGDGTTSVERAPTHTYTAEGNYTVTLNVITSLGAQGITKKDGYIVVDRDDTEAFFYVSSNEGTSVATSGDSATEFTFVDQTDGDIIQRYWVFDDGSKLQVDDPNNHTATHTYQSAGTYEPTLLIIFSDQQQKKVVISESITVL